MHWRNLTRVAIGIVFLFGIVVIPAQPAAAQDLLWTRQFGSASTDLGIGGVALDASGNAYVAGFTEGALPGQTSAGGADAFVRKYDPAGNELWTRQFGGACRDFGQAVAVDASGNAYVAGSADYCEGDLRGDAFVRKYDPAGNALWTRQFGSPANDEALGVAVDASGNVYVAGATQGTFPGQTSSGSTDAFLRKYDGAGGELWTRQFGSPASDAAFGVAVDARGNVYVAGNTQGTLPGQTSAGGFDAFVRKYDSTGNELWTRQFGSPAGDVAYGVTADGTGNAYVAGPTAGTLPGQTSAGGNDAFVRKYDPAGNELWTRQFGTASSDEASTVRTDATGNAYVAGTTYGGFTGQSTAGGADAYVRAYDSAGSELWTHQFGSAATDAAHGVAVDASGSTYVAGYTYGALAGQTSAGGADAFLVKLGQPLPTVAAQCKKGGWQTFGVFKNQGDCVSFLATKGKNPPAN